MIKACVLRIEGTNCEDETKAAFGSLGVSAEIVNLKQLTGDAPVEKARSLSDYHILMLPGGWSSGDYVRAGAIFAARMKSKVLKRLSDFIDDGKAVGGICNGFQILVEAGMLPAFDGISEFPEAALTDNLNGKFQCRPVYLRCEGECAFTGKIKKGAVLQIPVAHAEGRLTFGENNDEYLKKLIKNKQIVFRYCREGGEPADGKFPHNPNGSLYDIAGISNPKGNVMGMMPHPERVMGGIQKADWTRNGGIGNGRILFESVVEYAKKRL